MRSFAVGLILLAVSGGSLSAQVSVALPEFGTVRAGESVRIEWRGLPNGVEELELLLSVEGRELPVRVTPQLAARAGMILWRVPNLPSRHARLTIRFGLDGEEIQTAPSEPFTILPSGNEPPPLLAYRDGEWWADGSRENPCPGSLGSSPERERVEETRERSQAAVLSPLTGLRPKEFRTRPSRLESIAASPVLAPALLTRQPVEVPARI